MTYRLVGPAVGERQQAEPVLKHWSSSAKAAGSYSHIAMACKAQQQALNPSHQAHTCSLMPAVTLYQALAFLEQACCAFIASPRMSNCRGRCTTDMYATVALTAALGMCPEMPSLLCSNGRADPITGC